MAYATKRIEVRDSFVFQFDRKSSFALRSRCMGLIRSASTRARFPNKTESSVPPAKLAAKIAGLSGPVWGTRISEWLNDALAEQGDDLLLNLASTEYFSAVKRSALKARIIDTEFKI